jgi:hypothetical protein
VGYSKKWVLVNTPTLTWAYTRKFKERGKTRSTSVVSSSKRDAVYLNKKIKNGLRKILTNKSGKVENETVGKLNARVLDF